MNFSVTVQEYHLLRLRVSPQPYRKKIITVQDEIRDRAEINSQPYAFY